MEGSERIREGEEETRKVTIRKEEGRGDLSTFQIVLLIPLFPPFCHYFPLF